MNNVTLNFVMFFCLLFSITSCSGSKNCPKKNSWEHDAKYGSIDNKKLDNVLCLE